GSEHMNLSPLAAVVDGATPGAAAPSARAEAGTAFDNILALETLAAATPSLDAVTLEDLTIGQDGDSDDGEAGDIERPRDFLGGLMKPPVPSELPAIYASAADAGVDVVAGVLGAPSDGGTGMGGATELAQLAAQVAIDAAAVGDSSGADVAALTQALTDA